jgi:uncharacterized membrane-anchored protein
MKQLKSILIVANLVVVLFFFNRAICSKEETLANGQTVLLELAPVDPRSLMSGDYMRLSYAITSQMWEDTSQHPKQGFCILRLDEKKVGQKVRFQRDIKPTQAGEIPIKYFATSSFGNAINLGAESYFFEEGKADSFAVARYGCLKVDDKGNSILVGLCDSSGLLIKP